MVLLPWQTLLVWCKARKVSLNAKLLLMNCALSLNNDTRALKVGFLQFQSSSWVLRNLSSWASIGKFSAICHNVCLLARSSLKSSTNMGVLMLLMVCARRTSASLSYILSPYIWLATRYNIWRTYDPDQNIDAACHVPSHITWHHPGSAHSPVQPPLGGRLGSLWGETVGTLGS